MSGLLAGSVPDLIVGSPWAYAIITGSIAGSAVFPPLPSESMLVAAMSLAVAGELGLVLVSTATIAGAFLADMAAYALGRTIGGPVRKGTMSPARAEAARRWLQAHEASWGPGLIIDCRFIPGGTTAVGVCAGLLSHPFRQFAFFSVVGAMLWTAYGAALSLLGQAVFPGNTWAGVILAVLIALETGALVHLVRSWRRSPRGLGRSSYGSCCLFP